MSELKSCAWCGDPFKPNRSWQKYCSGMCSRQAKITRRVAQGKPAGYRLIRRG